MTPFLDGYVRIRQDQIRRSVELAPIVDEHVRPAIKAMVGLTLVRIGTQLIGGENGADRPRAA